MCTTITKNVIGIISAIILAVSLLIALSSSIFATYIIFTGKTENNIIMLLSLYDKLNFKKWNSGIETKQDANEVTPNEQGSSQLGILFNFA